MTVNPFYTKNLDNNQCSDGKRIKPENRESGAYLKGDGESTEALASSGSRTALSSLGTNDQRHRRTTRRSLMPAASSTATCGPIPGSRVARQDSRVSLPRLMNPLCGVSVVGKRENARSLCAVAQSNRRGAFPGGSVRSCPRARQPKRRTRDLGRGSRVRSACGGGSEHAHRIHALALTLPGSGEDMHPLHALCTLVRSASMLSRAHCRPRRSRTSPLGSSTIP
jgi:hypothetical protein